VERRVSSVDLMLLGTILLWALNITVTRYALTHGFRPLAYAAIRYGAATALFWAFTWQRERTFRVRLSDGKLIALAAALIFTNQLTFVAALHLATASTVALVFGSTPIFAGIIATVVGLERPGRTFWGATAITFAGVGLIASSTASGFSTDLLGALLALATALTWAGYAVSIAPLMRRYSPFRISALVLILGWFPLALLSIPQLADQHFGGFGWPMWLALAYAIVGPLFLTNILWFTAIDRVGPSRATLFANLQPFFAVLFALLILSEHLNRWEVIGGVAIGAGIALERIRRPARQTRRQPVPAE
jgi:drug/metabolite transporter (DMT)-like permease